MKKQINIALLGFGTVGSGVYEVIEKRQENELPHKVGAQVHITKVMVRNPDKYRDQVDVNTELTTDWQSIINDDNIDIVIELIGGIEPARTYILEALGRGKHVISANKDLIAVHGQEIFKKAAENHCDFMFEASALGAIPIIQPIKEDLAANQLSEIVGIMNGTTNYILTKMTEEGWDFQKALDDATALGYAEADPTADIEGLDAGRKVAILATIAFHTPAVFSDVYVEGITKITPRDIAYAKRLGCVIKLLGITARVGDGIEMRVHPALIAEDHPLATVNNSFNAAFIKGDAVGEVMFYGHGAGRLPTASAVAGDVINICRNMMTNSVGRVTDYSYDVLPVCPMSDVYSRFFVRFKVQDTPGVLAKIGECFGDAEVSIAQVIQSVLADEERDQAEVVVITHCVQESAFQTAMDCIELLNEIHSVESIIRVYGDM